MKKNYVILILILFSGMLYPQKAKLNEVAPRFTLRDSIEKEHSLSDYEGKIVVLEWINFECPFVKKHYRSQNMQSLQEKYTKKGIVWLAICSSVKNKQGNFSNDEINRRSEKLKAKFLAYLIDENGTVGRMYGAKTTPNMYIINGSGKLVYVGGIDDKPSADVDDIEIAKNYVSSALDELLSGEKVSIQRSTPYGCSVKY